MCSSADVNFLHEDLRFNISRRDERSTEDFSGKFFVKIKIDNSLIDVVSTGFLSDQVYVWSSQDANWLYDQHQDPPGAFSETDGVVNSSSSSFPPATAISTTIDSVTGMLNTASEWSDLVSGYDDAVGRTFFIDNLSFVSSNPNSNSLAREAGEGWFGVQTQYEPYSWQFNTNFILVGTSGTESWVPANVFSNLSNGYFGWGFGEKLLADSGLELGGFPLAYKHTTIGGFGLQPHPSWPSASYTAATTDRIINGMEGFVTSNPHTY